ncbi:MAG TPA: thioredoxin domain-containing protein [Chloroflexota bacterium]|nr:thioredoxin domain-containing protein [Chloroflexota bacterium]
MASPQIARAAEHKHTNRLARETSPYLLQHAHNPVDWYPWSPEAFEKARAEDKPLLLSVGYSACHWCHVMERESFEDEDTARLMNERFVPIKVDREERPDVDAIYMEAVTSATGHGGWPMTVFLLPDGSPMVEEVDRARPGDGRGGQRPGLMFYGGTYFPKERRYGMPSFRDVLMAASEAYAQRRESVLRGSERFRAGLGERAMLTPRDGAAQLDASVLAQSERAFAASFDATWGGFGRAPKFPQPMGLEALLRAWRRSQSSHSLKMVTHTLDKMAQGGMYDHLGGGFARYSVDERWLVPHFEKMLYDNAQLARCYLLAHLATGNAGYRRVCEETLDYVVRDMTSPEGGFYSAEDADSEGEEGKFYVWTPAELAALLGDEDARIAGAWFDVTDRGNFEHKNILNTPRYPDVVAHTLGISEERLREVVARARHVLFEAREQRVRPGRDDKVLTAWNGLMLRAFADAAASLERDDYLRVAIKNADFVLATLRTPAGRLLRSYKDGQARFNAYLEDYAFYAAGLLSLYEATFELRYFAAARELIDVAVEQFADDEGGGFFDTSADHEALVTRPKDLYDNATPSGNSVAVETLLRLSDLTGDPGYRGRAERVLISLAAPMGQHPTAFGHLLCAYDFALGPVKEIAIVGDPTSADTRSLVRALHQRFLPNKVVALRGPDDPVAEQAIPLLADRPLQGGRPTAYVCQSFTCNLPVTTPDDLAAQLDSR